MANFSWRWDYPYNVANTRTVGFAAGLAKLPSGTLSSDDSYNWRPPGKDNLIPGDDVLQTADGQSRAYRMRQTGRRIELSFVSLPEGSAAAPLDLHGKAGVEDFLVNGCDFSQEFFEFYPHVAEAEPGVKVRYVGGFEAWTLSNGLWTGTIILRREDS